MKTLSVLDYLIGGFIFIIISLIVFTPRLSPEVSAAVNNDIFTTANNVYALSIASSLVDANPGLLHTLNIDTGINSATIQLYDVNGTTVTCNTHEGTLKPFAKITLSSVASTTASPLTLIFDAAYQSGLCVEMSSTSVRGTVTYR